MKLKLQKSCSAEVWLVFNLLDAKLHSDVQLVARIDRLPKWNVQKYIKILEYRGFWNGKSTVGIHMSSFYSVNPKTEKKGTFHGQTLKHLKAHGKDTFHSIAELIEMQVILQVRKGIWC